MNRMLLQLRGFRFPVLSLYLINRSITGQVYFLMFILQDERVLENVSYTQGVPFNISSLRSTSSRLSEEDERFSLFSSWRAFV